MAKMTPAEMQNMSAPYMGYTEAMIKAGAFVGGDRLERSGTATTARVRDGKTQVLDGPYADTKEQLGGYYLIEAPNLDAALSWAARCPGAATGVMEVRPVVSMKRAGAATAMPAVPPRQWPGTATANWSPFLPAAPAT